MVSILGTFLLRVGGKVWKKAKVLQTQETLSLVEKYLFNIHTLLMWGSSAEQPLNRTIAEKQNY